ncbi:MAG: protein kinase [Dolichospermum sp. DEX189]|nr:protein kinase [Dolichospermum sp. DEX189]
MTLCINCNTQNPNNDLFCQQCGSDLLLEGRYRANHQLGVGGFGATYEVSDQGTTKVLKVLRNNSDTAIKLFQREAKFLGSNNYPGIPKADFNCYFQFEPKNSQQAIHCLVMEKIEGVNLKDYIKQSGKAIKGDLALRWLKEIVEILDRVHSQDIIHRDIKPHNIMLKPDGKLTLIDFGAVTDNGTVNEGTQTATAKSGTQTATHKTEGTKVFSKGYAAPEQIEGNAIKQSDIYSLGRTFVYLLTAKEPNDPLMYDAFNDKVNWRSHSQGVSPQFADLIDLMIQKIPAQRPVNTQVILQQLQQIGRVPKRGEDIEVELKINDNEAQIGTQKEINISRLININGNRQQQSQKLTVTIPKNTIKGQKLRLKGQGNVGEDGGENGDVYATIIVEVQNQAQSQNKVKTKKLGVVIRLLPITFLCYYFGVGIYNHLIDNRRTNPQGNQVATNCNVNFNGKVRSEPSSQAGNTTVVSVNTNSLSLTGTKTHGGWNQVKLPNGDIGWVHDKVVTNQIPSECITQRVNDSDYIKSQPPVTPVINNKNIPEDQKYSFFCSEYVDEILQRKYGSNTNETYSHTDIIDGVDSQTGQPTYKERKTEITCTSNN